jgi:hypothetical protein
MGKTLVTTSEQPVQRIASNLVLTKKAALAALVQHPHLGIHLLRLVMARMLQNAGLHSQSWPPPEHRSEMNVAPATGPSRVAANERAASMEKAGD